MMANTNEETGTTMNSRVLLVIPAYNEAENIVSTVSGIQSVCPQYDYVVINDGSRDETAAICKEHGYNLIDLPVNLGLAGAFQSGMKYALRMGYDYAVQYDGDGQHLPQYVQELIKAAEDGSNDIVIGSRFVTKTKPLNLRMLGSRILTLCILLTTGKHIKDPTSGMRCYSRRLIGLLANKMNYGPEPDTVAFLINSGAQVSEVQVDMQERTAGQSYLTFANSIKYMLRMCSSILIAQYFRKEINLCH